MSHRDNGGILFRLVLIAYLPYEKIGDEEDKTRKA